MTVGGLPAPVAESVDLLVDSLDGLEVLLALAREPDRGWTAASIAAHLKIAERAAHDALERLRERGVVQVGPSSLYRWGPVGERERAHAGRILDFYERRRIDLINYVASSSLKRIRGLADAFRLRRDDPS